MAILFSGESAMGQTLVSDEHVTLRETATSVPGVPSPGHEDHQIVMARLLKMVIKFGWERYHGFQANQLKWAL